LFLICSLFPVHFFCKRDINWTGYKVHFTETCDDKTPNFIINVETTVATNPEFKENYARRAGVEGTISQAVGKFNMRRTRYFGLAKTHLQHIATACAINLSRFFA